jgi:hypothetical protein
MKSLIAEAAIAADMEHRGFQDYGNGQFAQVGSNGNDYGPVAWRIWVKDGEVRLEMLYGSESDQSVPSLETYTSLQTDVFDYWPQAIDEAFKDWEDFPSADPLGWDKRGVLKGAAEIAVSAAVDDDSGSASGANVRLDSDITNLITRTAQLQGEYAVAFSTKYVSKLRPVLDNLHALTLVLAYALAGEEELFRRTREQIANVANDSLKAMQASGPRSDGDVTGLKIFLIVVGAVCAGVGAVAGGGVAVPVALKVAASLTGAGASASGGLLGALVKPPPPPEPIPLGAGTPQGVLTNLKNGLAEIKSRVKKEEEQLDALLKATHTDAQPAAAAGPFNIAKPDLIGKHSSVLDPHQVLVDDQVIGMITELWIPTIVGDLKACTAELTTGAASWTRPASIGISATGPWPSYSRLQSDVASLIEDTATELTGSAESLRAAAADIGLSDDQVNATLRAQARKITEDNVNY